ncbi:hypothetical protein ACFPVT_09375 [Corynebacterium choanae]
MAVLMLVRRAWLTRAPRFSVMQTRWVAALLAFARRQDVEMCWSDF